jgi:2-C-methyl-D-erythritol 2,4-cyclodiphosphate synthase
VPSNFGALGHSDGDVLVHSIIDAFAGVLGLGSIGELFPPNEEFKDAYSLKLLKKFSENLKGIKVLSIDAVLILSQPRLVPFVEQMKKNIADALNVEASVISIKPKSGNNMKNEFIECYVNTLICLI